MTYNSNTLNNELGTAFRNFYPSFRALRLIVSAGPGGGKSTLLASVPVSEGYTREMFDHEDSQAFLDAGKDGVDVYTPRRQQFRMNRVIYPTLSDYADVYERIARGDKVGALCIDNIAIFQDELKSGVINLASNPPALRALFKRFGADSSLPVDGMTKNWARYQDGGFWAAIKLIPQRLIIICNKQKVHFLGATEEGNVWENYGGKDAKITGKKAKLWDVWTRHTDVVLSLTREVNKTTPPKASLYPNMPKNRLQGMNPTWHMDWAGFITEINAANKRTSTDIPVEAQVVMVPVAGDDDIKEATTEQTEEIVQMSFVELVAWATEAYGIDEPRVRAILKDASFKSYAPDMAPAAQEAIKMGHNKPIQVAAPEVEPTPEPAPEVEMVPGTTFPMSEMIQPDHTWPNLVKYAKKKYRKDEEAVKLLLRAKLTEMGKELKYEPKDHIAFVAILDFEWMKQVKEVTPDFMQEPVA